MIRPEQMYRQTDGQTQLKEHWDGERLMEF